ncbi:MAG: WD40/YVTN/BNR-like repeat-containing protein [Pseudomonadota bacterium]
MRLSPTHVGLLLTGLLSVNTIAQEGSVSTSAATDYEVIEAPALTSTPTKIKSSVLIEIAAAGDRLVAVGDYGNIIYRSPEDSTWQQASVPTSVLLTSVTFFNDLVGYATGHHGVILKTTDGGKSWQRVLDGFKLLQLEKTFFQQQVAALEKQLARADDADIDDLEWDLDTAKFQLETVQLAINESGPTKPFVDIVAMSAEHVIAVGAYNTLVSSQNGGQQWQLLNNRLDNPDGYHLNSVAANGEQVFIAGEAGTAYRSRDSGQNWESVAPPYSGSFFGTHFADNGRVWLYGLRGNVFYSDSFGDRYQAVDTGVGDNISGGFTQANGDTWLVGNSGIVLEIESDGAIHEHRHPSNSVLTDIVPANDEKILTGRSGMLYWPVKQDAKKLELMSQGAQ